SLHTAVFSGKGPIVEIQVRTKDMHDFAEYGIAAHHSYKGSASGSKFDWIAELGELKTETRSPNEYLKELRTDYFSDRIFAMTPAGDVIDLPRGATVLDFAFAVHTDVGLNAQGGKINGAFKALKTPLKSEDIVEVITAKNARPTADWIDWCKTNLAESRIRRELGMQRKPIKAKYITGRLS
ncbi:MAG: TGS domain-containing protein, partial [Patescibacteria group bacterium]